MKKHFFTLGLVVGLLLGGVSLVTAAPSVIYQKTLLPIGTSDLGSIGSPWNHAYLNYVSSTAVSADTLCVSGSCGTVLGDPFAWTPTTHFGVSVNSTSTPLWLQADLYASSTIRATTSTNQIVVFEPEGTQVITAASDTINGHRYSHYHISSDADYVMSSTPTIPDGVDGQMLILTNTSTLYTIDMQDESGLTGSNILLNGASATIRPQGTMTLLFDDTVSGWYVISNPTASVAGANASTVRVRNVSGTPIAAGKVVYATGYNSGLNRITIDLADADVAAKMPAIGITTAQINNNANGDIVAFGNSVGVINTIGTSVNQGVWVGTSPGEVVFTRPAADSIQKIGLVTKVAAAGSVLVQGAGRTNDVPYTLGSPSQPLKNIYASSTAFISYVSSTMVEATSFVGNLTGTASQCTAAASDSTWTLHNSYPAACGGGQYVSAIGDTLTCSTPTDTGDAFAWTPTTNYGAAANSTSTPLWVQGNFFVSGTAYLAESVLIVSTSTGSIMPGTANTHDLGSYTYPWNEIYVSSTLFADTVEVEKVKITELPDTDHDATGTVVGLFNAGESVTVMNLVFMHTDGELWVADADLIASSTSMLGLSLESKTDGQLMSIALPGSFVRDDTWNWTPGALLFVDTTAGGLTATAPSGADDVVRVVGYAVTADVIYFYPEPGYITVTG